MNALTDLHLGRLAGLGWAVVVVGWALRFRPPSRRIKARLNARAAPQGPIPRRPSGAGLGRFEERVGRGVLRVLGRPHEPVRARRLGRAVLVGVIVAPVAAPAAPPAALVVWALPALKARRVERRRLAAVEADLPDVVDLLTLAVGAGLTVHLALEGVARRASGPLGRELAQVCREAKVGRRLADALESLPVRAGEATRPLVAALVASERYGAPVQAGLERLAVEVRLARRRAAEEAARRVPVKLLFPLVTCSLPAFALLTVAPLVASGIRSLPL